MGPARLELSFGFWFFFSPPLQSFMPNIRNQAQSMPASERCACFSKCLSRTTSIASRQKVESQVDGVLTQMHADAGKKLA